MLLDGLWILNKYLMNHGRTSQFNWNEIQAEFEKISNTKVYSFRVLKNKYDDQRKDYNLWTSLKMGQLKQPSSELQECWYQLFGDKVATGVEVVAPSINRSTFVAPPVNPSTSNDSYHVNLDAEDEDLEAENGLEDLEAENQTFFSSFIDEVGSENVSTSNQIGGSKLAKKSAKTSTKPAQMKRSGRESAVITVMNRMVEQKLLPEYGDLWCFGMTVLEDPVKREFFLNFPADAGEVWMNEVLTGNPIRCVNAFRMHPTVFINICGELESKYGVKSSDKMSVVEKVGVFIYILAVGVSNRDVGERFQRSGETISRAFHEVLEAITGRENGFQGLAHDIIRPKDPSFQFIPSQIMNDQRYMPYFKENPDYIPQDELHDIHSHETNNENNSEGASNEMKQIRNGIATLIWNAHHV
ncbi:hypothetical protein CTI12_AA318620 [Artemisia annua]|uniref:DUF8040 domain-containing protein n=1 Tax=Artemisia annua TaxID=35608 RepID=A0A2U1N1K9_ARTAN|nr:hypothetical protein CTI12_AA318620 [Artemisia annua]